MTQPASAEPPALARPLRLAVGMPHVESVAAWLEHARWAEQAGFDSLWMGDMGNVDPLTLSAAIAQQTERIGIGTAVVPVMPRTPAVFASIAYTLHQLSGGRFALGLGVSSETMMGRWHGLPFERPRTRIAETVRLLRHMLAGEKTDFAGETIHSRGFCLPDDTARDVPIYLAALRGRMLQTAGELADGVILNRYPLPVVPRLVSLVREGARKAGRDPAAVDITAHLKVCVTDEPHHVFEGIRQRFAGYYSTGVYNKYLAWCGYEAEAAALAEGWRRKERALTLSVMDDALLSQFITVGSVTACRDAARSLIDAGVTTVVVGAYTTDPDVQRATFDAFTPQNFPLDDWGSQDPSHRSAR